MTIEITPLEAFLIIDLIACVQCTEKAVSPELILFAGKLTADVRLNHPDIGNTIINDLLLRLYNEGET